MTRRLRANELWEMYAPAHLAAAIVARGTGEPVLGLASGEVVILDAHGREARRYPADEGPVTALAVTDDAQAVAVARPACIELWNRMGRRLDRIDLPGVTALDLRGRDGTIFAASGRRFLRLSRSSDHTPLEDLPFAALGVRAGEGDWAALASGDYGELALYDEELRVRWKIALRGPTGPAASDVRGRLILLPSREVGICAFDPDGTSLGVYETPTPADRVVSAPGGERLLVADARGGLYLLLRERGLCVWSEPGRGPLLAMGVGDGHVVTVGRRGRIRYLRFGAEDAGRAGFLELRRDLAAASQEPVWFQPLPPRRGPFLGRIACSRDGRWLACRIGATVTVWDDGGMQVLQEDGDEQRELLWGCGERLFLADPEGIEAWDLPSGRAWRWDGDATAGSPGDRSRGLALLDDAGRVMLLDEEGRVAWSFDMPEHPTAVHADEGMEAVGVVGMENGFYLLSGTGEPIWKRRLPAGCQVLLAGRHVYTAEREGRVSCYGYGEQRDWRTELRCLVSHLFRVGDRAFLATRDNRFYRIEPEGGLTQLDRRSDAGTSRLVRTRGGDWREVHVLDDRVTCFDLEGSLLWSYQARGDVDPRTIVSGEGVLAMVAGAELLFFGIEDTDPALPHRYLEI